MSHSDRKHLPFSASQAHRLINCNGPIFYAEKCPPQEKSEHAELGEKFHQALEILLEDFLDFKTNGTDADIRSHLLAEYDEELLAHAREAKEVIWEKGLDQFITGKAFGFEDQFVLDERLGIGGICDFWCIYRDRKGQRVALIVDYKYGYGYVDENNNPQLATYAVSLREEFLRAGKDFDYIRVAIYQPRAGGDAYREFKFTQKALTTWKTKLTKAAKQAFVEKKIKLKAGEWCTYCPAASICVELKRSLEEESGLTIARKTSLPTVESLSIEQRVKILEYKEAIEKFMKAVYSDTLALLKKGGQVPGLKLVNGTPRRQWLKETEEIGKKLIKAGLKEPFRPLEPELITITDAEKALTTILESKDEAKKVLEQVTELKPAPEILVPESDPRAPIKSYKEMLLEK